MCDKFEDVWHFFFSFLGKTSFPLTIWLTFQTYFTLDSPLWADCNFVLLRQRVCPSYNPHVWGMSPKTNLKNCDFVLPLIIFLFHLMWDSFLFNNRTFMILLEYTSKWLTSLVYIGSLSHQIGQLVTVP